MQVESELRRIALHRLVEISFEMGFDLILNGWFKSKVGRVMIWTMNKEDMWGSYQCSPIRYTSYSIVFNTIFKGRNSKI